MPIYDNDGTANREIGKLYDHNGSANTQIGKVYDNNGSANSLIYSSQETFTASATNTLNIDSYSGLTWLVQQIPAGSQFVINEFYFTFGIGFSIRFEAWINNYTGTKIASYLPQDFGPISGNFTLPGTGVTYTSNGTNAIYIQFCGMVGSAIYNTRPTSTVYIKYTVY